VFIANSFDKFALIVLNQKIKIEKIEIVKKHVSLLLIADVFKLDYMDRI